MIWIFILNEKRISHLASLSLDLFICKMEITLTSQILNLPLKEYEILYKWSVVINYYCNWSVTPIDAACQFLVCFLLLCCAEWSLYWNSSHEREKGDKRRDLQSRAKRDSNLSLKLSFSKTRIWIESFLLVELENCLKIK